MSVDTTTVRKWKATLIHAREIRAKTAGLVFDRMQLLMEIFEDEEFRQDEGLNDMTASDRMDAELADVCAGFGVLKAVLELHPSRHEWEGKLLHKLVAEAKDLENERRRQAREPREVKRVNKAEFNKVDQERQDAVRVADGRAKTIESLKQENSKLKEDLAVARYRIKELEGLLNSSQQVA